MLQNKIKDQARQHERFRQICIQSAQAIHQWDMRFKLGLLQDTATQEKQARREAAEALAAKHKHEIPTVKTEAQTLLDEDKAAKEKEREEKGEKKQKETTKPKVKIRPLSEAKAIDSGANFVSETFLLLVGVALILGENWRQNRKQKSVREDVADRLEELEIYEKSARKGMVELEKEVLRLRTENLRLEGKNQKMAAQQRRILPPEVYELEEREQKERQGPEKEGFWEWIRTKTVGEWHKEAEPEVSKANLTQEPAPSDTTDSPSSAPTLAARSVGIMKKMIPSTENNETTKASQMSSERREDVVSSPNSKQNYVNNGKPS